MTRGSVLGMHIKMILEELGFTVKLVFECDATAALEASAKMSHGRMRHLLAADTFVRHILKSKQGVTRKIPTSKNLADLLSKHVSRQTLESLLPGTGWGPVDLEDFRIVDLKKINNIKDLENAEAVEIAGRASQVLKTRQQAATLAQAVLAVSTITIAEASDGQCEVRHGPGGGYAALAWLLFAVLLLGFTLGVYATRKAEHYFKVPTSDKSSQSPVHYTFKNAQPRFVVMSDGAAG